MSNNNIAFLGLGTMGFHMAKHLCAVDDFNVRVYNRSETRRAAFEAEGHHAVIYDKVADAVAGADIVISCLGRDEDLIEVALADDGIINTLEKRAIYIDHSTISSALAVRLGEACLLQGNAFIDAPVSGGEAGAINGQLSVMCGGEEAIIQQCQAVFDCYAKSVIHMGNIGQGQLAKMANQITIAGLLKGLSEAVLFAEAAALDINRLHGALSGGAAQSWQLDNRMLSMHERQFDFGFAIKWMEKDLSYALAQADALGLDLQLSQSVLEDYRALMMQQLENSDTSCLIVASESSV